jgi:hypothetical protein
MALFTMADAARLGKEGGSFLGRQAENQFRKLPGLLVGIDGFDGNVNMQTVAAGGFGISFRADSLQYGSYNEAGEFVMADPNFPKAWEATAKAAALVKFLLREESDLTWTYLSAQVLLRSCGATC